MVDNKSDVDSPTPFATGSTSAAEVSTAAAGSSGHSTSSHQHQHANASADDEQRVSGHRGEHAPSATDQAADREPAEGGDMDDEALDGTGADSGGDIYEQTGNAGFSPGTEGGLGGGAAPGSGGDPSAGANEIGNTSPVPEESRPPENL